MTDMQRDLLTEDDRARIELALLRMERATGSHRGEAARDQRQLGIRRREEFMSGTERRRYEDRVMDGSADEGVQ